MQYYQGKAVQHVESGRQGVVLSWYPWHEWSDAEGNALWHEEMACFPGGKMWILFSNNAICMRWMHRFRTMHPGRALFVRQSPQWVGGRPPPPEPFRDGEVPPPPPAAPPPKADSHGNRVRPGKKQREQHRATHEAHVAAWNAQEERFAAMAREEAQADMLAAEALESAEIEEGDLLHLQAMHEKAMAERSQYELDEAADVAAVATEQADVARPPVPPVPPVPPARTARPAGPPGRPAGRTYNYNLYCYIYIYLCFYIYIYMLLRQSRRMRQ